MKDCDYQNDETFYIDINEQENRSTPTNSNDIQLYISSLKQKGISDYNEKQLNFMLSHFFSKPDSSHENIYLKEFKDFILNIHYEVNSATDQKIPIVSEIKKPSSINELLLPRQNETNTITLLTHKLKRNHGFNNNSMKLVYKPQLAENSCNFFY
jgi:hypothetical protein